MLGAIIWLASMLAVQTLLFSAIEHKWMSVPAGLPGFTFHALVMVVWSVALVAWCLSKRKPLWALGISLDRVPGDLLFALVAGLVMGALYLVAGTAVRLYFEWGHDAPQEAFSQFLRDSMFKDLSLGHLLGVVLLYPILEELWYRGVLYGPMRAEFGRMPAILITSVFFALAHSNVFPINQFFGGLVFAIAYEYRRTLVAPILLHIAGNGALAAMGWLLPKYGLV